MKFINFLSVTALVVLGSLVPGASQQNPNNPTHTDSLLTDTDTGDRMELGIGVRSHEEVERLGGLIWPVKTGYPDSIIYISFRDPSWDGQREHQYAGHTGIDIGVRSMSASDFNHKKSNGEFPDIIAAADGVIIAAISDQGDFCTKGYDPKLDKRVLQLGKKYPNCTAGCAEDNCGGNYVLIDHDPEEKLDLINLRGYRYTSYWHLQTFSTPFSFGEFVKQGDTIGKMGSSGNSSSVHLHFDVLTQPLTPADATDNEDPTTQSWANSVTYAAATVDPFYSWQGGGNNESSGFQRSMWDDQCNLPIYGDNLKVSFECGAKNTNQPPCDFSSIQLPPKNSVDLRKACGR